MIIRTLLLLSGVLLSPISQISPSQWRADEVRLRDLLTLRAQLTTRAVEAQAAYEQAMKWIEQGEDMPTVGAQTDADPGVIAARHALGDAYESGRNVAAARRALDDAIAEARARATATIIESLRHRRDLLKREIVETDAEVAAMNRAAPSTATAPAVAPRN